MSSCVVKPWSSTMAMSVSSGRRGASEKSHIMTEICITEKISSSDVGNENTSVMDVSNRACHLTESRELKLMRWLALSEIRAKVAISQISQLN